MDREGQETPTDRSTARRQRLSRVARAGLWGLAALVVGGGAGTLIACVPAQAPVERRGTAASFTLVAPIPADQIGVAVEANGTQTIEISVDRLGYHPAVVLMRRGVPAIIRFLSVDLGDCNAVVEFPGHDVVLDLAAGERDAVLTPLMADFVFHCGEGLRYGYVRVVDDPESEDPEALRARARAFRPAGAALAPCCGY